MPNYGKGQNGRSNVLAWSTHTANMTPTVEEDAAAEVDEPPDNSNTATAAAAITRPSLPPSCHSFRKTMIPPPREHVESLLTRALHSQSEDETAEINAAVHTSIAERRRSMTSNTSLASTAGFTSDTGITTPARTNSPSPRLVGMGMAPIYTRQVEDKPTIRFTTPDCRPETDNTPKPTTKDEAAPAASAAALPAAPPRKRCISFACAAPKPSQNANDSTKTPAPAPVVVVATTKETPVVAPQPRRPCIKFACPAKPTTDAHKPQVGHLKVDGQEGRKLMRRPSPAPEPRSPTTARKNRGSSSGRSPRSITPRSSHRTPAAGRSPHSPLAIRSSIKKYLTAGSQDLDGESSRFHEFASDQPLEEDWIRHSKAETRERRLTINDTLQKENAIRRLGKEAEEEAEQEEQEDEENEDGEDDDEEDDNDGDDDDEDEDEEDDDDDDDDEDDDEDDDDLDETETVEGNPAVLDRYEEFSDGYNTDNEIGFASSDDEDDGLVLWSVNHETQERRREAFCSVDHSTFQLENSPKPRRMSGGSHSDSSTFLVGQPIRQGRSKITRPYTPELPDSTDFVCGTFDEDRPLEEAYLSHMAARKQHKLHAIPQDIDPSFPTSDVEEESGNNRSRQKSRQQQQSHQGSGDSHLWQLEDLHHDKQDRANNSRTKKADSPRRYHSPPPPTKNRGRSPAPRRLFDRHSPGRRFKSPAPRAIPARQINGHAPAVSPPASPVEVPGGGHFQTLAFRPGLTTTKSLPRPAAIFRHQHCHQQHQHTQGPAAKHHRRPKANNSTIKPMHIRGALDIVKGLEQKRQRRKEKFQAKYCNRARKGQNAERKPQRGEGAERMREIGLLMAGKTGQGNYVMSC